MHATTHDIILNNCKAQPLAGYLKALGVLKLVHEQLDPKCRGFWNEHRQFVLRSTHDRQALIDFFVNQYHPTPIVTPWNGGSGFSPGENRTAIDAILKSNDLRFEEYRQVINNIFSWPEMPATFHSVSDLVQAFSHHVSSLRPGKKQNELQTLLDEYNTAQEKVPPHIPQHSLEDLEKQKTAFKKSMGKPFDEFLKAAKKIQTKVNGFQRKGNKEELIVLARARFRDSALGWMDAALALREDNGAPDNHFNPILGSGGNEGRLDFSSNFMQNVVDLLLGRPRNERQHLLTLSLFGGTGTGLEIISIGQFDPGRAGGFNQGPGIEHKNFPVNRWDFVLMLEGSLALASAATRKMQEGIMPALGAVPFTVRPSGVGFDSSSLREEKEKMRAETWLPVWIRPAGYPEIRHLMAEGRCQMGKKPAQNGIDFIRGIRSLGVDRGFSEFIRYVYVGRRGDNYLALPADIVPVTFSGNIRLLDDLDIPLDKVARFIRQFKEPPGSLITAHESVLLHLYACSRTPQNTTFMALLRAIGRLERLLATRDHRKPRESINPLSGLSARWLQAADDQSVEFRIAAALASIRGNGVVGPIRANLCDVNPQKPWTWAEGNVQAAWRGASVPERLASVLHRRLVDAIRFDAKAPPWSGTVQLHAQDAVALVLHEHLDWVKLEELLWAFMWMKHDDTVKEPQNWSVPVQEHLIPREYALLHCTFSPDGTGPGKTRIPMEPSIINTLLAGRVGDACQMAQQRLFASGLVPFRGDYGNWLDPVRLAATLLVPISNPYELERMVLREKNNTSKGE